MAPNYRDQVQQFFSSQGYSPNVVSGIMGNLSAESNFNPTAYNPAGGGQGAFGIAQWRGARYDALRAYADERGTSYKEIGTQLNFMLEEAKGAEKVAWNALMSGKNPVDVANIMRSEYERSGPNDASGYRRGGNAANAAAKDFYGMDASQIQAPQQPQGPTTGPGIPVTRAPQVFPQPSPNQIPPAMSFGPPQLNPSVAPMNTSAPSMLGVTTGPGMSVYRAPQQLPQPPVNGAPQLPAPSAFADAQNLRYEGGRGTGVSPDFEGDPAVTAANARQSMQPGILAGVAENADIVTTPDGTNVGTRNASVGTTAASTTPDDDEKDPWNWKLSLFQGIEGIGVGLGQMSAGQPVNLGPMRSRINNRELGQQAADVAQQNADTSRMQEQRLGQPTAAEAPISQGMIDLGNSIDPAIGTMLQSRNPEIVKAATDMIKGRFGKQYDAAVSADARYEKALIDAQAKAVEQGYKFDIKEFEQRFKQDEADAKESVRLLQNSALSTALDDASTPEQVAQAERMMDVSTRKVYDARNTAAQRNAQQLVDDGIYSSVGEAMLGMAKAGANNFAEDQLVKYNIGANKTVLEARSAAVKTANESDTQLAEAANINERYIAEGTKTGVLTPYIRNIVSAADQLGLGGIAAELGLDATQMGNLDTVQQAGALAIARANANQGSITEAERANFLKVTPNEIQTVEGRARLIARTRMMNAIERRALEYYSDKLLPDKSNVDALNSNIQLTLESATAAMSLSAGNMADLNSGYSASRVAKMTEAEADKFILPNITARQAKMLGPDLLPDGYWDITKGEVGK